ncbi:MAG: hypothetical protein ACRDA0_03560 [Cetobacterium sp.]|uniref:hypothetical protein n=1 Tax=Cetobacterium sp. TaxID=2071632 RepID=UPI003F41816D
MISLEDARDILSEQDFEEFENLEYASQDEEYQSAQWYTTRSMMNEILAKYNLETSDPFDVE